MFVDPVFGLGKYLKKLIGNTDIEDSLQKLDKLTQEEARMASAEQLRIAHSVEGKVIGIDKRVRGIGNDVQDVGKNVEDVRDEVQGVDRKLDDTNRWSSPNACYLLPNAQVYSQRTCSVTIFCDGFRLPIRPQTTTLHPKLIMTVPLSGFFKAVFSTNGSPPVRFCGYTENVCFS